MMIISLEETMGGTAKRGQVVRGFTTRVKLRVVGLHCMTEDMVKCITDYFLSKTSRQQHQTSVCFLVGMAPFNVLSYSQSESD